jgi:hypothetical protein
MTFGGWNAPSEEDLEAGGDFTTLPEDEYVARVTSIEIRKDQPNKYPSKNDNEPLHDMLVLKADALTFADGEPLTDINDDEVEGTVPFQVWLNPKKRGMIPQPSKTRRAFAAILGQPVGDPIDISDFQELVGKTFIVSLKPSGSYNNAEQFRAIKRSRVRGTTPKGPVDGEDLVARATEIFNEDSPTNTDPIQKLADDAPPIIPKRGRPAKVATTDGLDDDLDF